MNKYMRIALAEAIGGMHSNEGGPFGAVVVRRQQDPEGGPAVGTEQVVARAHNRVISTNDPTAHAEIEAIRIASSELGRFDLSDCDLYATCEPCPMCLAAILWARIPRVFYGCSRLDAEKAGFSDAGMHKAFETNPAALGLTMSVLDTRECSEAFHEWDQKIDRVVY